MANDIFLKKVYDQYLNTDYEYGVSNLNPKREISPSSISSNSDISKRIEDEVRRQFNLIKEDAKQFLNFTTPKPSTEAEVIKEKAGSVLSANHNSAMKTIPKLGGSLYDPGLEESSLVDEIDDLIFKLGLISTVIDPTKDKPYDEVGEGTSPINQIPLPNGCCLCHGDSDDGKKSDSLKKALIEMRPTGPEDQGLLNSDEIKNNAEISIFEDIWDDDPSLKNPNGEPPSAEKEEEKSYPIGCMLENLEILKSILAVLKVLQTIKRTILRVIKTAIPLIKICARCAAAWTCPPSAGEALQLILEKVNSILIGVAGELLQMLWDMLQLDCLSNMALELKDQILQILSGSMELWNDMTDAKSWTSFIDEYSDAWDEMTSSWGKAHEKLKEDWKKREKFGESMSNAFKGFGSKVGKSWADLAKGTVDGASGKINSFVDNISSGWSPQDWADKPEDVKDSNEYGMARGKNALDLDVSANCAKTENALEGIEILS